jgi:hypothetical protein
MAIYHGVLFGSSVIDDVRCVTVKAGGFRLCVVVDMLVRSRWILRCRRCPFFAKGPDVFRTQISRCSSLARSAFDVDQLTGEPRASKMLQEKNSKISSPKAPLGEPQRDHFDTQR